MSTVLPSGSRTYCLSRKRKIFSVSSLREETVSTPCVSHILFLNIHVTARLSSIVTDAAMDQRLNNVGLDRKEPVEFGCKCGLIRSLYNSSKRVAKCPP